MALEHVRIDYDEKDGKVDIQSTTGDPWKDLQVIMEGMALCMAICRKKRNMNAEALSEYVKQEIHRIANSKNNYTTTNRNGLKPPGSFLLKP